MKNLSEWRKQSPAGRLQQLARALGLDAQDLIEISQNQPDFGLADTLIENAIGYLSVPLGVATHLVIDGRERLIPMAIEETSVVASVSATAKWIKMAGGTISTTLVSPEIMTQVQIPRPSDPQVCKAKILAAQGELIRTANTYIPSLVARGGGFRSLRVRVLARPDSGSMVVVDLFCDPRDSMGANVVTQAAELLKPDLLRITGDQPTIAILSNWTDHRIVRAEIVVPGLSDAEVERIQDASMFAEADPYRAATHNKGIMNGVDSILVATGNDWRAVEAGAHAHACRSGTYRPLSTWRREGEGRLVGRLEIPIAAGIVGGVTRLHPAARLALKILGSESSEDLCRVVGAVGLTQNLAALRALSGPGLTSGHMKLHAANLARMSGATTGEQGVLTRELQQLLTKQGRITASDAKVLLEKIRQGDPKII